MLTSALRRTAAVMLGVLIAGCSDPLGPSDVTGVYELERIGGEPLPAVLLSSEYHIVRVLSDTITLHADGTGTISGVQHVEWLLEGFEPEGPRTVQNPIRFRVRRSRIEIDFVCPPNALCIQGPHIVAWKTRTGLRAKYFELVAPLVYSRVAEAP